MKQKESELKCVLILKGTVLHVIMLIRQEDTVYRSLLLCF